MYRAERSAEKKIKDKRRRQLRPLTRATSQPTFSKMFAISQRLASAGDYAARRDEVPTRRLGPCFKISV